MKPVAWMKALPLFGISFVEMSVAFVRMMILTHILGPYEFGFAAAISAAYAMLEQSTDIAMYRFVLSTPRTEYRNAIAGAHALGIFRGSFVASCFLIAAYPTACLLANCGDWNSFAWLAPVALIKSFEHLEVRVRERDYYYWPQLIASISSHACGLAALTFIAYQTQSHYAFIAYLLVQSTAYVLATHLLAKERYQVNLQRSYLRKAAGYGFPLMINGIGLALIAQGDRLMVGAILGLPALGHYAVLILAAIVPIGGLFRILGSLHLAGLQNARADNHKYFLRIQLFSRTIPMIAACYALILIGFLQPILPRVFGPQYAVSELSVLLVAMIAFLRIVRIEPNTPILLNSQQTGKLAVANLSMLVGLFVATALVLTYPTIEALLVGGLIGEAVGLCVMFVVAHRFFGRAIADYVLSVIGMLSVVVSAAVMTVFVQNTSPFGHRAAIVAVFIALVIIGAWTLLPKVYRAAYGSSNL